MHTLEVAAWICISVFAPDEGRKGRNRQCGWLPVDSHALKLLSVRNYYITPRQTTGQSNLYQVQGYPPLLWAQSWWAFLHSHGVGEHWNSSSKGSSKSCIDVSER